MEVSMPEEGQGNGVDHRPPFDVNLASGPYFVQRLLAALANLVYIYDLVDHCNVYTNQDMQEFLGYTE
jgi:hypothetical protein